MAGPPKSFYDNISGAQRDAFLALESLFKSYGLESLVGNIRDYAVQGYGSDVVTTLLTESPEYRARFKANEDRKKKGLRVLSPAEYIQTENAYKATLRNYGLPQGFYDSQDDYQKFLGNDVSPQELEQRVQAARATVLSDNPQVRDTYKAWFASGLSEGDAISALLDPNRAMPEIEKKARAAALGAASNQQGVGINKSRAEYLANMGVSGENANQQFGQVAEIDRNAGRLSGIYGSDYNQADAENAVLLNDSAATQKIKKLGQQEAAAFGGRGVGDSRSIGRGSY